MLESLGHYRILDRIGSGGTGEIYRARDTRLGRTVALKVVREDLASSPAIRDRIVRQAQAAAACSHPNIAALYEVGEDQGRLFLVCEFVPGDTLRKLVAGRPLNPRRAVDLAAQLADAIAEIHGMDLVHGALSAESVMVTPKGSPKILDCGLSAAFTGSTPSEADDLQALGVLLYEMLSGELLTPTRPGIDATWPLDLQTVVRKALAGQPAEAYQSPAALAAELRTVAAILDARASAAVSSREPVVVRRRPPRRGWMIAVVLVAAAIVVAALLVRAYR